MNGVTDDSVVFLDVNSSAVVSDVEGTSLGLAVVVSSKLVEGVVADSVLAVEVSTGKIKSTTHCSVRLFTPKSVRVIGIFLGIPNIWTSLAAAV